MKTSQAWSMDIMIAIVVFIGAIFIFYSILSGRQESKADELRDDALRVLKTLNITQNATQIKELSNEEYEDLKGKLRVGNEFCIYLEDEDGNIIYIEGKPGIGSNKIEISGKPCVPTATTVP